MFHEVLDLISEHILGLREVILSHKRGHHDHCNLNKISYYSFERSRVQHSIPTFIVSFEDHIHLLRRSASVIKQSERH